MTIKVIGVEELTSRLAALPPTVRTNVVREMSQFVYDRAQDGADNHTKTGALLQSLYNRAVPDGREIGHDPQRAPHAVFVHWGTRPHDIRPKDKRALRWVSGGAFAFAKKVRHPGYAGDPWLLNAARDALARFDDIVQSATRGL